MSEQKQKLLIIDADQFIVRTLTSKLGTENLEIKTADQASIGIEILNKEKFDLIILDLVVPLLSGYAVLENLQKNASNKNTPVIILTNLQQEKDIIKAFGFEILDYVLKYNMDVTSFIQNVQNILENPDKKLDEKEKELLILKLKSLTVENSQGSASKIKILKCSKCEATLPPKTEFCPYCGTPVETEKILQQNY